jgi:hypothetical protein
MKRRIFVVLSIFLIIVGLFLLAKFAATILAPRGKGALQVTSNLKAQVTLNGNPVGTTPVILDQEKTIDTGIYDLKIVPEDKAIPPYSAKINVNPGVLTAVDRTFLPGGLASAYILTLEKASSADPQIFIATVPDAALVSIDGESKDVTPYNQTLPASEHEIEIAKVGFTKKTVRVRAVENYKLVLNVILGAEVQGLDATLPLQTTAAPSASPTPSPEPLNSITILNTPVGFLRVRENPSTSANEIGRVNPGEKYEFVEENPSWVQIKLKDGTLGWVSKTYTQKSTTSPQ